MNKPSERIVVFVTPAQKRAISATADELGISVSELMRRAVIAFSATSDQVKAASIVDRLNAPREPDALAQVLRKAAKPLRAGRGAAVRPAAQPQESSAPAAHDANPETVPENDSVPDLAPNHAEHTLAQTVARLAAEAHAAQAQADAENALAAKAHLHDSAPLPPLSDAPFTRTQRILDDEDAQDSDSAPESGKFA
ncbi:hypothetical protein G3N59_06145 [Paraburkholderia sp. Ac-20340]|uniref:plasmid mobilization protein n=1 Tax=Paraburkholderia sp. Ac-20340 TaxID=2703888 RepID=UPI00197E0B97|nr:hypothetical protein [Paraburkholderia sp. Ac-20340]MBN3852956.1 hypothetical protein [Paraburkholderia sp. Ac-20340]